VAQHTFAHIKKGYDETITFLLKHMLDTGRVEAVFCLVRGEDNSVSYSLISDADQLENAVPFFPAMPGNAGKALSRFTKKGASPAPVAAVLRPCELRAFIEIVKREQGSRENMILISSTCGGVYPLRDVAENDNEEVLRRYNENLSARITESMTRDACRICEKFEPVGADITFYIAGKTELESSCHIMVRGEKMKEIASAAGFTADGDGKRGEEIEEIRKNRHITREQYYSTQPMDQPGVEGLMEILGKCVGCRGCSNVCPICYCETCFFRTAKAEHTNFISIKEIDKRGAIKLPPLLTLFHLGRMTHMAHSCVGCGMCSDVCPVRIPVGPLFQKVGEAADLLFDYEPGRDIEELPPLSTFQIEELETYGE